MTNYFSKNGNGDRLDTNDVKRAVIIIHGLNRDPGTYMANTLSALGDVPDGAGPDTTNTQIIGESYPEEIHCTWRYADLYSTLLPQWRR